MAFALLESFHLLIEAEVEVLIGREVRTGLLPVFQECTVETVAWTTTYNNIFII